MQRANRLAQIEEILEDLKSLQAQGVSASEKYGLEENIAFFEAIKSLPSYLAWLRRIAPNLDRKNLLELSDFPFEQWDREMHRRLIEMERKDFPGLVAPLVDRMMGLVSSKLHGVFLAVNLGSGGMEVDRQVIKKVIEVKHHERVVLVGVDKSPVTHDIAKKNLSELEPWVAIHEMEDLNQPSLEVLLKSESRQHIIILCKNDIFKLGMRFDKKYFDVVYHSLFKHHLSDAKKREVDVVMKEIGARGLDYDGYKNWHILLPQTIVGWNHPVFLNAEIFSNFRFFTKPELYNYYEDLKISFYQNPGTYLVEKT